MKDQKRAEHGSERKTEKGKRRSTSNGKKIALIILAAVIAVAAIGVGIFYVVNPSQTYSFAKKNYVYRAVSVNNINIEGLTDDEALAELKKYEDSVKKEYSLKVTAGDNEITVDKDALEFKFNTEEVLKQAKASTGGETHKIEYTVTLSNTKLSALIESLAAKIDKTETEPEVTAFDFETETFTVSQEADGFKLDTEKTASDVTAFFKTNKTGSIEATVNELKPKTTKAELEAHLGKIADFSTTCTNNYASESNMRLAMELMDKKVVEAGGIFSFHETVGDSTTAEGGWMPSGAYRGGKLVQEYGGGICQAATTMYNCALLSNMEVIERYCHLQPSSYCEIGLDATVDYPYVDTKMKNNSDYPIYVSSVMEGKILTMTMYGYISDEYDHIETNGWYTKTTPRPAPEFEVDTSLAEGEYVQERSGYTGYDAEASRKWFDADGNVIKEEALPSSHHSEIAPLYYVGPNTDTSLIPADSKSGTVSPKPESPASSGESSE